MPYRNLARIPPGRTPRKRNRVRNTLQRMQHRRTQRVPQILVALSRRGRRRKRKTALAISVGAIGLSTSANYLTPHIPTQVGDVTPVEKRDHASELRASDTLRRALIEEEGARLTVYRDPAGHPTVGIGHKVLPHDGLREGDRIRYDDLLDFLEADLGRAEDAVVRLVGNLPLFQHEFDALVDLVFNVGEGTLLPHNSPRLNAAIRAGDHEMIATELDYSYAGGDARRGLAYRSERRANMFVDATYRDPRSDPEYAITPA